MTHCPPFADEAAFPRPAVVRDDGSMVYYDQWGLTRREYFAAAALTGIIAAAGKDPWIESTAARLALEHANALLAALAKEAAK